MFAIETTASHRLVWIESFSSNPYGNGRVDAAGRHGQFACKARADYAAHAGRVVRITVESRLACIARTPRERKGGHRACSVRLRWNEAGATEAYPVLATSAILGRSSLAFQEEPHLVAGRLHMGRLREGPRRRAFFADGVKFPNLQELPPLEPKQATGISSSRSQRANVLGSTPSRAASSFRDQPCPSRCRLRVWPSIIQFLGHDPRPPATTVGQRHNFAHTTISSYLHAVEQFARHFKC